MKSKSTGSDLVIKAILKLDRHNGVLLFIQSCYAGLVRTYDFEAALQSLAKLADEEQHALIAYVMRVT
jgi:hypothetical protein